VIFRFSLSAVSGVLFTFFRIGKDPNEFQIIPSSPDPLSREDNAAAAHIFPPLLTIFLLSKKAFERLGIDIILYISELPIINFKWGRTPPASALPCFLHRLHPLLLSPPHPPRLHLEAFHQQRFHYLPLHPLRRL
jgi:hypothetical protein